MAKSGPQRCPTIILATCDCYLVWQKERGRRGWLKDLEMAGDGGWSMWVLSVVTRVLLKGGRWIFASHREERGCEDGAEIWRCCAAGLEDGRADTGHQTQEYTSRSWERPGTGFSAIAFWGAPAPAQILVWFQENSFQISDLQAGKGYVWGLFCLFVGVVLRHQVYDNLFTAVICLQRKLICHFN